VVGRGVTGVARDRRRDLGIARDRRGDVRLGQRPGVMGIRIGLVRGKTGGRRGLRGRLRRGVAGAGVCRIDGRRGPGAAELTAGCRTDDDFVRQLA
jgi:hypothetical protein